MERELLFKILYDGIKEMVFVIKVLEGPMFEYEFLNKAVMENLGLRGKCVHRSIREVHSDSLYEFLQLQYHHVLTQREAVMYEDSYYASTGELRYSETTLTPLFDDDGKVTHIVGIVKDITARKTAEDNRIAIQKRLIEKELRYKSIFDHNSDAVYTLDLDGRFIEGNEQVFHVTGYSIHELFGASFTHLIVPADLEKTLEYFKQAVSGTPQVYETSLIGKDGQRVYFSVKNIPIIIDDEVKGIYGIAKNITDQRKIQAALLESERRYRLIAENSQDLITLLDVNNDVIYSSPSHMQVLGVDSSEVEGKSFLFNIHSSDQKKVMKTLWRSIQYKQSFKLEFRKKHPLKGWIWVEAYGTPVYYEQEQFQHMVVVSRDITSRKSLEKKLKHMAYHDPLTGLMNRRAFERNIEKTFRSQKNHQHCVMVLDSDNFKLINDNYGHDAGDEVIKQVAKRLSVSVRDGDMVSRLGGDEFAIFLPNLSSKHEAFMVVDQLLTNIRKALKIKGIYLYPSCSIGLAFYPNEGASTEELLKCADQAMYKAKETGGNTFYGCSLDFSKKHGSR